jgi:hypothetical protein
MGAGWLLLGLALIYDFQAASFRRPSNEGRFLIQPVEKCLNDDGDRI